MKTGWNFKNRGKRKDLTQRFQQYCKDYDNKNIAKLPKDIFVIFVPGLMANRYGNKYMKENLECLKNLGVGCKLVLEKLKDEIYNQYEQRKKIIIFAYSKGGIDTINTICENNLYDYIFKIIFVQVPWAGSILAEEIQNEGIIWAFSNLFNMIFNNDSIVIQDLNYKNRIKAIKSSNIDLNKLDILCFYSKIGEKKSLLSPLYSFFLNKYGIETDGIVAFEDACIDGKDFIFIDECDHSDTIFYFDSFNNSHPSQYKYNSMNITYSLIVLCCSEIDDTN
jgi:hypothetical protein